MLLSDSLLVEGEQVKITNPDKLLWPDVGISKLQYMQKLVFLAPYLLPYCRNRYLTTIRYPNGIHGKSFYQKNAPQPIPDFVTIATKNDIDYVVLDRLPTLLWLGNLAALEFHPSFDPVDDESPLEWVLDIDPSVENEPRLMEAIAIIGRTLTSLGIEAIPKTSGATGVQIVIPIQEGHSFDQLRRLGQFLAEYLVQKHPQLFTVERLKKHRGDLIYIDYLQHAAGKSLSSPYSPRGRKLATLSTPLTWDEVERNVDLTSFNLHTIEARLNEYGELIAKVRQQDLKPIIAELPK